MNQAPTYIRLPQPVASAAWQSLPLHEIASSFYSLQLQGGLDESSPYIYKIATSLGSSQLQGGLDESSPYAFHSSVNGYHMLYRILWNNSSFHQIDLEDLFCSQGYCHCFDLKASD